MLSSSRKFLAFLLAISLFTSLGCRRFTSSYVDISQGDVSSLSLDSKTFFKDKHRSEKELEALLEERKSLANGLNPNSYSLGPDDLLSISVFGVEELSAESRVQSNGLLNLSIIGDVHVGGLKTSEVEKLLVEKYSTYLREPKIKVEIKEYGAHKVSVIGEVVKPGSYNLTQNRRSLLEVLSEAGGRSAKAGGGLLLVPAKQSNRVQEALADMVQEISTFSPLANVYIDHYRQLLVKDDINTARFSRPRKAISIDFSKLLSSENNRVIEIPLISGDTIIVPEAGMVHVDGEVEKPGIYPLASKTTLLGAVAAAGGLRYAAAVNEVEVIRSLSSGEKALLQVNLEEIAIDKNKDIALQNGDVVRVPSAGFRFATNQVVDAINKVVSFGVSGGVR